MFFSARQLIDSDSLDLHLVVQRETLWRSRIYRARKSSKIRDGNARNFFYRDNELHRIFSPRHFSTEDKCSTFARSALQRGRDNRDSSQKAQRPRDLNSRSANR